MKRPQTVSKIFRQAAALLLCLAASAFPLFGNDTEALTKTLRETIGRVRHSEKIDYYEAIDSLLDEGADVNGIYDTSTGRTFLIEAADRNDVLLAQIFMDHGADPNALSPDPKRQHYGGNSAVFYGNKEITALFISRGARFDVINAEGTSPLGSQMYHMQESAVLILEWEQEHSPGFSANFESREEYLTGILADLLDKDFLGDVNSAENYILTKRLLEAGANPAAMYKDRFPVAYLTVKPSRSRQIFISLLIEHGAPVDAFNKNGETALYCAAKSESIELAVFLLEHGADPNQQNKDGETALMAAPSEEMTRLLLDSGADPNLRNKYGRTALMNVRKREFINLFFQAGADPTLKDNDGRTVLHLYNWFSYLDGSMIDDLTARGCLIDEPDKDGFTPLMRAVSDSYYKAALTLLEKGADPHYRDSKGRNALHLFLLEIEEHTWRYDGKLDPPFVTALLEAGIRPADKDDEEDSALITVNRLARKEPNTIPLRDLVLQYADAQDAKTAQKTAAKMVSEAKREKFSKELPDKLKALSIPIAWGGLSVLMREAVFKNDPYNFMGWVNGTITLGGSGMFVGLVIGAAGKGDWEGFFFGLFGAFAGAIGGIILASIPSVIRTFNENPLLYYIAPAAIGIITIAVIEF